MAGRIVASQDHQGIETGEFGPWGTLEYLPIVLEPTDTYISISNDLVDYKSGTVWKFEEGRSVEWVANILITSGFEAGTVARLTGKEFLTRNNGSVEIRPPGDIIERMTDNQRSTLYPLLYPRVDLSRFHLPFSVSNKVFNSFDLVPSGLSPEIENLIERLSYKRGETIRFSDVSYVFGKLNDEAERNRVLKVLGREVSLSVRLRLDGSSDLNALSDYWGGDGRNAEVAALLESVVLTSGVDCLDIAQLLPPVPRKWLNTYPTDASLEYSVELPDCFSSAFSFFAQDPPERHLDFVGHIFRERYVRASRPLQYGDLIMILDSSNGDWIHACNFIADDLVFSKNGKSMGRPWVIARLDDVVRDYLSVEKVSISFFRLKPEFRE